MPIKGASGHEEDGSYSQSSSITDSNHSSSSRKNAELNLILNQSKHSQQMISYYSAKKENESRESQTRDKAFRLNSMQTNIHFLRDLISGETDAGILESLKERYRTSLDEYMNCKL